MEGGRIHPNVTYFAEAERARPGATTMDSRRRTRSIKDLDRLAAAAQRVVERHDALQRPIVLAAPHDPSDSRSWWTSYRLGPREDAAIAVEALDAPDARARPPRFDLEAPPRACLQVAPDGSGGQHLRLWTSHAMADGVSLGVFWNDLARLYEGRGLEPLTLEYREHVEHEASEWQAGAWQPVLDRWIRDLDGFVPPQLPPPAERLTRWPMRTRVVMTLDDDELERFGRLQRAVRSTPFATAVGLLALAEREVFGWRHAAFFTPVANRRDKRTWNMIGLFANIVHLHVRLDADHVRVLRDVRGAIASALKDGHVPLFLLRAQAPDAAERLDSGARVAVRQPDTAAVTADDRPPSTDDLADLHVDDPGEVDAREYGLGADLLVDFFFGEGSMTARVTYRADRFHARTIESLVGAYKAQLHEATRDR